MRRDLIAYLGRRLVLKNPRIHRLVHRQQDVRAWTLSPIATADGTSPTIRAQGHTTNPASEMAQDGLFPANRVAGTLVTTLSIQALSLISGALLARALGVHDRGLFAAMILWPVIAAHVGDLGGPVANTYLAAKRPSDVRKLIGNSLFIAAVQTVVLTALTAPILLASLRRYGDVAVVGLGFLIVYLPANLLYRYLNFINQGLRNFAKYNRARLSLQGSYLLVIVAMFLSHRADIRIALAAYALSHLVAALVAWTGLRNDFRRLSISWTLMHDAFSYGVRAHLGNLTPIDMMQLDLAVVVLLLRPRDAGLYAVASSAALVVRAYGGALGSVALPHIAAANSRATRQEAAGDMFRLSALLILVTAAVIIIASPWLVPLVYGRIFAPAVPLAQLLSAAMVAASLRQVLGDCLRGAGKPLSATIAEVVSWVVAALGLAVLVPKLETVGAALAVSASYSAALAVSIIYALGIGVTMRQLFIPRRDDFFRGIEVVRSVLSTLRLAVARGQSPQVSSVAPLARPE